MDDNEGEHIVGDVNRGSRKRRRGLTSRERKKEIRYSDLDPELDNFKIRCTHKRGSYECKSYTKEDVKFCRNKFFKDREKSKQDLKISHLLVVDTPKRKRSRKDNGKSHNYSVKYKMWSLNRGILDVCQKLFCAIFSITRRRIDTTIKKIKDGANLNERRCGDRRSAKNKQKTEKIKQFISQLNGRESHYGRSKSRRIYLSSEYNISILHKLYNKNVEKWYEVNYKFFSRIFNKNFNIGFGSPATDVCSFCERRNMESAMCSEQCEKNKILLDVRVHKVRAQQFYKLMKERPLNTASFCFDLQQVQVLPKVPIQEAFYAQQLAFYSLCITDLDTQKPVFYTWMENEAGRGPTEICSGLRDFFNKIDFSPEIGELRLFSDGCPEQNKNNHVLHLLMIWLHQNAPKTLKTIQTVYPVRGHSFLPADRVFGRIERITRRHSIIKTPEKYYEIYSNVGKVRKLGTDWQLYDIKSAMSSLKKVPGISTAKRLCIKRSNKNENHIVAKPELYYRNIDITKKFESLLKRGKSINNIVLPNVALGHDVKQEKLQSLEKLVVSLSGNNWQKDPELEWLQPIITPKNLSQQASNDEEEKEEGISQADAECNCEDDDVGYNI